jgi:membrane protein DedA with SNARE-associated domain
MNLTLNHWIRFVGIATTVTLVLATALNTADKLEMVGMFAFCLVGCVIGQWLSTLEEKGD